ncbi:MAG: DUF3450 domain-containing protein [Deltaproteobacteria bacterium]|nr:DUF3450 domain-containing protein [Deltaproteobacteria bacterium]
MFSFGFLVLNPGVPAAATVDKLQQQSSQVMQQELAVQTKVDSWSAAREALVQELLNAKTQCEWDRFQNKKFHQYVEHKKNTITELRRQQEQMTMLRRELEPFLDTAVEELTSQVGADLPFLARERRDRLGFLSATLTDPELLLGEKLRRVLEALQVEADYGNSVEVSEEKITVENREKIVQILRLGRLVLFYLTLDGREVGQWDRDQRQWRPLASELVEAVRTTIDIIQQKRVAILVRIPLPAPLREKTEGGR